MGLRGFVTTYIFVLIVPPEVHHSTLGLHRNRLGDIRTPKSYDQNTITPEGPSLYPNFYRDALEIRQR